jgi:hypothetical protein
MIGKKTFAALYKFKSAVVQKARQNLGTRRIGKNTSYGGTKRRNLQNSLYGDVNKEDGDISFGSMAPYAKYIHYGVSGTKKKRRDTPFSYGNKMPPVDAIAKWMKVKPVRLRDANGSFVKATPEKLKGAAFGIAKKIQEKGIPGLAFYDESFDMVYPKHESKIAEAMALDILEELMKKVTETDNLKEG